MESSREAIEYAWNEVCQKIYDGICLTEIHAIAEAIKDLECIEKFMETMDEESKKMEGSSWLIKNIRDEIWAVGKYVKKFEETQTSQFKTIAKQEWEHAGALIKMVDNTKLTAEERAEMKELVNKYNELATKIS